MDWVEDQGESVRIRVAAGSSSRNKVVEVSGVTEADVKRGLQVPRRLHAS